MNSNTLQTVTAEVSLGGEVRTVELIRRDGQTCYWSSAPIICRFPTGTKLHTKNYAQVFERNGRFEVARRQTVANRNGIAYAWADDTEATSRWGREHHA